MVFWVHLGLMQRHDWQDSRLMYPLIEWDSLKQIQTDTLLFTFRFQCNLFKSQTETLIFFTAQGHILGANLAPLLFLLEEARELLFGQLAVTVAVVLVKHQVNLAKIMSVGEMFCVTCHDRHESRVTRSKASSPALSSVSHLRPETHPCSDFRHRPW